MNVLLRKDLRLTLDALRPWALIFSGLIMAGVIVLNMPGSLAPDALRGSSFGSLLTLVAAAVGMTAIAVSAWSAVAVAQGDRAHGAHLLAWTTPIAPARRAFSKLLALLAAVLAPPFAFVTLLSVAGLVGDVHAGSQMLDTTLAVAVASLVGAGLALGIAPIVRGSFSTVALALLLGLIALFCGGVGAAITTPWFGHEYSEAVAAAGFNWEWDVMSERARWIGAVAGLAAASTVCGVVGTSALRAPISRRMRLLGVALALAVALVGGAIAAAPAIATDPTIKKSSVLSKAMAQRASTGEIIAAISRMNRTEEHPDGLTPMSDMNLIWEGQRRAYRMRAEAIESDPIARALRAKENYSSIRVAKASLRMIPRFDPRRLAMWLDAVAQFPTDDLRPMLLVELQNQGLIAGLPSAPASPLGATLQHLYDSALVTELTRLAAAGHPEQQRMERVIEAMKAKHDNE